MNINIAYSALLLFSGIFSFQNVAAKKLHYRHCKFEITIPDKMVEFKDGNNDSQGPLYYDSSAGIIMIISEMSSKYKSVSQYLDCTHQELEQQLRTDYGDSMFTLLNCSRSLYYPKKTTTLHFQVSSLPFEYNTYTMYFIHHRHNDIQISFTYKKETEKSSMNYVNAVMQTLKLK